MNPARLKLPLAAALAILSGTAPGGAQEFREVQDRLRALLSSRPRAALAERARGAPAKAAARPNSWPEIIEAAEKATVRIEAAGTVGTGFIIEGTGLVVTNAHVTGGAKVGEAVDIHSGAQKHAGKLLASGSESCRDLALVGLDPAKGPWPTLSLSDAGLKKGQEVVALGFPAGPIDKDGEATLTVSRGIVSGLDRRSPETECLLYVQTDAAINPGNSGGPLLTADGRVAGISTWLFEGKQNLNFAIRVEDVLRALAQYRRVGHLAEGSLGLFVDHDPDAGALVVRQALPGRAAAKAGILHDDVIVGYDGRPAGGDAAAEERFVRHIRESVPGDSIALTLRRGGSLLRVSVAVEKFKPAPRRRLAGAEDAVGRG